MDEWTLVTSALTGLGSVLASVIAGILAGRFGVRTALRRFRMQRGFERQLEWHEKTARAVIELGRINEAMVLALKNRDFDWLKQLWKDIRPLRDEFRESMSNSLLYSDRHLYLRLREIWIRLEEIDDAEDEFLRTDKQITALYEANVKLLQQTIFELCKPIREMLGLNALRSTDFQE